MSGGSLSYFYLHLQEHIGDFGDEELDDLVKDLADLFYAREWYLSSDTCKDDWREARDKFKKKWFTEQGHKERIEKYLSEFASEMIKETFGIDIQPSVQQSMTAASNTVASDTVKIPVMDGTTERLPSAQFERCKEKLLSLSPAQPEPTFEQIEEYCHKRGFSIVDNALLHKYARAEIQPDIIRCKDCKYLQKWRSKESAKKFGQIYACEKRVLMEPVPDDFCSRAERRTDE